MLFASSNHVRIRYEVVGQGQPLLMHIGGIGALEDWYDAGYVSALQDEFRLILLDPRGQGQSEKPHEPAAYSLSERVADVCAVLDAAEAQRAHFWGYSLGGQIGYALGARAGDRLSSLILGGASPFARTQSPVEEHPLFQGLQRGMPELVAMLEQGDPGFWTSDGERARWLTSDPVALSAGLRASFDYPSLFEELPKIQVPTLIYCGDNDDPDPKARAAREMPHATFVALQGLDHAGAINRSDQVLPHVRAFLARQR